MRLWHYKLLRYLPDAQFKGQLRELVAIMHDWRDKGKTNNLLINKVMEYPKSQLSSYFLRYCKEYRYRYGKEVSQKTYDEFSKFAYGISTACVFLGWHTKEYLRMNMSNLAEKHFYGIGKSRITNEEWKRLCEGYKAITGEEYKI